MALYNYQCLYCENGELQIAGSHDRMAICPQCGNLMLRKDEALFWHFVESRSISEETISFYDDQGPAS